MGTKFVKYEIQSSVPLMTYLKRALPSPGYNASVKALELRGLQEKCVVLYIVEQSLSPIAKPYLEHFLSQILLDEGAAPSREVLVFLS